MAATVSCLGVTGDPRGDPGDLLHGQRDDRLVRTAGREATLGVADADLRGHLLIQRLVQPLRDAVGEFVRHPLSLESTGWVPGAPPPDHHIPADRDRAGPFGGLAEHHPYGLTSGNGSRTALSAGVTSRGTPTASNPAAPCRRQLDPVLARGGHRAYRRHVVDGEHGALKSAPVFEQAWPSPGGRRPG